MPSTSAGTPCPFTSARKRATESDATPSRRRVALFALSSDARSSSRQRPCAAPKKKSLSFTIGPPNPPPSWFCVPCAPNAPASAPPHSSARSRSEYVNDPAGAFVPLLVVVATRPPLNCPRATSYVLVMMRVVRVASCGIEPPPKVSPSSVMLFAVGRWPATENCVLVESVAPIGTTPGASAANAARSLASIGNRSA